MRPALLIVAAALLSTSLRAQTCAEPTYIPFRVEDVSADGGTAVGEGFRWTASGGTVSLGTAPGFSGALATGVNADGSVVVGASISPSAPWPAGAFRWTAAGGMQDLGPGLRFAAGVSSDGDVVACDDGNHVFRWTAAGGLQNLGGIPNGFLSDHLATGISADGSTIIGFATDPPFGPTLAFRWTAAAGFELMGNDWEPTAVSADGGVVVGDGSGGDPVRWTAAGGLQSLGATGGNFSEASDVSADGSVVVGQLGLRPFRWTAATGIQEIEPREGSQPGGSSTAVNADGSVITVWLGGGSYRLQSSVLGDTYCRPTVANSTGCGGIVLANGDPRLATGSLELTATLLPMNSFGFFLASQSRDSVTNAGGSQGTLCLGGNIGRFIRPGQVMDSGADGTFAIAVDLSAVPTPSGPVAVQPGETWNFQAWHRDVNPAATSNFTDAVSITFE